MKNKKLQPAVQNVPNVNEASLFTRVAEIIETRKFRAAARANCEITLMYWEIGKYIGSVLLGNERAEYGKRILSTLSKKLLEQYGNPFEYTNLTRMIKLAELFPDILILAPLAQELSWSHFREILPLPSHEARMYYANEAATRRLGKRELRNQIARKAYERQEIANAQLTEQSTVPFNLFKDPYLLDTLRLKENFFQNGLQSRRDGTLLTGGFNPRKAPSMTPSPAGTALHQPSVSIFGKSVVPAGLATASSRFRGLKPPVNKMRPHAGTWRGQNEIMREAKERLERRKSLPIGNTRKHIDYFYEPKDDIEG